MHSSSTLCYHTEDLTIGKFPGLLVYDSYSERCLLAALGGIQINELTLPHHISGFIGVRKAVNSRQTTCVSQIEMEGLGMYSDSLT
ncbi:hypothetical protein scyTo_0005712 [Scyliorhinus torazame]|uniref:Uncharacterized protein n=1 Tax=Scyliorhinus torazame TaxID=75743 RepID=A0A401PBT2_SCYTO|nr:hypothetical protein [Scyliorhinus torazame]